MNMLQAYELETIPAEEERQRFEIKDKQSLSWVFRKLEALQAKKDEVDQLADAEIERIETYRENELGKLENDEEYFNGLILEYAMKKRIEDPSFKSEVTPYGRISYRKQQPQWQYDHAKLLEHLTSNKLTEFVRVRQEPDKVRIKREFAVVDGKVIDTDGQIVEGITVVDREDSLTIKVGG